MSNFGTIKARVSSEMKRGELSVSSTAVQSSVLSAIAYLGRRRFPWNEFHEATATASSSATYVPFTSILIAGTAIEPVRIDTVKVALNQRDYPLDRLPFSSVNSIDAGQFYGYPDYYALHGENIRLYPAPNQNMVLKISGVRILSEISAQASASASNAWTSDAEELVRLTAKSMLFRDELRNPELAGYFAQEAQRVMNEIKREVVAMTNPGRVRPYL